MLLLYVAIGYNSGMLYQHKLNEFVNGNNTKENEQILSQLIFDGMMKITVIIIVMIILK